MMRPPDSALLQRLTISLTASSLYSNGILWFSATRFLIRFLHDPSSELREPAPWRDPDGRSRLVPPPAYRFGEHLIWGATARVLQRFLQVTRERSVGEGL